MPDCSLAVDKVCVSYGSGHMKVRALSDVSLRFERSSLTLIMGPSGSGKTTLLSLIGCLLKPDDGSVTIMGEDAGKLSESRRAEIRRRHIGYVFQAFRLLHALPALENVMIASEISGTRDRQHRKEAAKLLKALSLGDKLQLKPNALSGGEKQRVAIARALLSNPDIILADEPTASLDAESGRQICEILRDLAEQQNRTVVVVSHDHRWAKYAHRTVVLEDGRLVEQHRSNWQ